MNGIKIPAHSILMLTRIKQAILDDNVLASKITGCGSIAAANYIDELIANASKMETQYHDYKRMYELKHEQVQDFFAVLHCDPDDLTDEQKAELDALVAKWDRRMANDD